MNSRGQKKMTGRLRGKGSGKVRDQRLKNIKWRDKNNKSRRMLE